MFGSRFNVKIRYSTPSQYVDSLKQENVSWPIYKSDLFPYESTAAERYHFWSGYYTSRPNFKYKIKLYSDLYHAYAKFFSRNFISQRENSYTRPKVE
jgi:hypothetical protein